MTQPFCLNCSEPLPEASKPGYKQKQFCGDRCRQAASRKRKNEAHQKEWEKHRSRLVHQWKAFGPDPQQQLETILHRFGVEAAQLATTALLKQKLAITYYPQNIYQDDFLSTTNIANESIDLIVTSPPYNIGITYNTHKDGMTLTEYKDFTSAWLQKAYSLLHNEGRLCVNVPLDTHYMSVYAEIVSSAQNIGYNYQSTIIWHDQQISRRTAWGSWLSAVAPQVIAPAELIAVFYKYSWKKTKGSRKSDLTRDEFLEWTNGVWAFPGESKKRVSHPAPFPVELPKRCIKLFSFVGDTVLDPFVGSGSTLVAALQTGRRGVGFDIDPIYCAYAKKRLAKQFSKKVFCEH